MTRVVVTEDVYQTELKKGDTGRIDGYVRMADDRGYAVVVRDDGYIDCAPLYRLKAVFDD